MIRYTEDSGFLVVTVENRYIQRDLELLLLSQEIIYWVETDHEGIHLIVHENAATKAKTQIEIYLEEMNNWPPKEIDPDPVSFNFSVIHFIVLFIMWVFHFRIAGSSNSWWFTHGRFSADHILAGEWHRIITALTLHLDDPHLFSNLTALLLFVSSISYQYGAGLSWFLVLVSGAIGNYLNALFYQTAHYAVGSSTAVFGTIGLMGVLGAARYHRVRYFKKKAFVPLIGALGIYAMMGTNPKTDVLAHFFGLVSGVGIGGLTLPILKWKLLKHSFLQLIFCMTFCLMIVSSWFYSH